MSTGASTDTDEARLAFPQRHFLARLTEELSDLIAAQSAEAFEREGLVIPVKSCSLMIAVERCERAPARQLADMLDRSHQLVSQKLPKLVSLGLLECERDPQDSRQKLYSLTPRGREQMRLFHDLQRKLEMAYDELHREAGDITGALRSTLAALRARSIGERLR